MKKYFIEGALIFLSVLSAFFLESYRVEQTKIELKDALMEELSFSIHEDLNQIEEVKSILNESLDSAIYLMDDFLSETKADKKNIAQNFSKLRSMNVSYFPRDGVYNQLLTTGSLELIKYRDLKSKLMYVYEHAFSRKEAVDKVLDEFGWRSIQAASGKIWVVNKLFSDEVSLITTYNKEDILNFFISNDYYKSQYLVQFYSQSITLMNRYINIINAIENDLMGILKLIEYEIKKDYKLKSSFLPVTDIF